MKKFVSILFLIFAINSSLNAELKFTFPKGGEKLIAHSDTLISWEKNKMGDTLFLEYSLDNGNTWKLLTKSATENIYLWKNIPNAKNAKPLMRAISRSEIYLKEDEPYVEWSKTYIDSALTCIYDMQHCPDGGYITVGIIENINSNMGDTIKYSNKFSKGDKDIWIMKIDSIGNKIFSKSYGGTEEEWPRFIKQTSDSCFIIGGLAMSKDFDFESTSKISTRFIIKIDKKGDVIFKKSYGDYSLRVEFLDIVETQDGGFILISDTNYKYPGSIPWSDHVWILKIDKYGNYEWSKTYGGRDGCSEPRSIKLTKDGGLIITGVTEALAGDVSTSKGEDDVFILKLDKNCNLEWSKSYGGSGDQFPVIIEENEDGYTVLAKTNSIDGDVIGLKGDSIDMWILKIDKKGKILYSKTYGGSGNDYPAFIEANEDGYTVLVNTNSIDGDITNNHGLDDAWFIRLYSNGLIKYQSCYGGSNNDGLNRCFPTSDKGFILAGGTESIDGDIRDKKIKSICNGWILKRSVKYQDIDTVTVPFSIIYPLMTSHDIDMGEAYVKTYKDSIITNFIENIGECKFRVDSIYISGVDKNAFSLIDGFPKYTIPPQESHFAKFRFTPHRVGIHNAEIVIITQTDTLIQKITGIGLKKYPEISASIAPFQTIICENSTATELKISNIGGDTLKISEINLLGTNYSDFSINATLPINIEQDSTKTLTISFIPKTIGIKTAEVEIKSNALADPIIKIPISARKDSIALVPDVQTINLGKLFPSQTKDTAFTIENKGTIETAGHCDLSSNLSSNNSTFSIDENGNKTFNFTFSGIATAGTISEKIIVWDDVCKYSREVQIIGEVVSPSLSGFSAVQCVGYENEYKLKVHNPSSNRLNITDIEFDNNNNLFEIKDNLPIIIEPYTFDKEIKVAFKNENVSKISSTITCKTDNKFVPILIDTVFAETVQYSRNTTSLINGEEHFQNNPFPISYDTASTYGKNKFTYSIQANKTVTEMSELSNQSNLEIIINYNTNVLGVDYDKATNRPKVRLGAELGSNYIIKSNQERKIDDYNAEILILIENTGKPINKKEAFELISLDFGAYLSNHGLSDSLNDEKSRTAIISHSIKNEDECLSYETSSVACLAIEKQCQDDVWQIKIPNDTNSKFYLKRVIPNPIGTNGATLEYGIGFDCKVTITIYDISGNIIFIPIDENQIAGSHKRMISTKELSSGVYYLEMKAGPFKESKKVVVE